MRNNDPVPKSVDYAALRKKFPTKDPAKRRKAAAIKAIQREYAAKRAALGGGVPTFKKGIVFYAVVVIGLAMLGSLVLSVCGKGGPKEVSRAQIQVHRSIASVAVALGRYRYHVGSYPSTEEGLDALAAITPKKKGWNGPYVNHVVKDPWGHDYVYVNNGESDYPTLYSKGADGLAGTTDDVLPDRALYDEPFKDTSWTKGWMPYYLRGYVLAPDKRAKSAIEDEVKGVLAAEQGEVEGEFPLVDGWESGRRTIELPERAAGKFVAVRFEGVAPGTEVFLDGESVGRVDGDGARLEVDISAKVKFGEKNELSVKDFSAACRRAKLVVEDYEDRAIWGSVRIMASDISIEKAKVRVSYLTPVSSSEIAYDFEMEHPVFWDIVNPRLYDTKVCGKSYRYGIRTAEFKDGAFRLNGREVPLRGVSLDSLIGPLEREFGSAALRRRLKLVKDMGANSVRTDMMHVPSDVLELCDEMGMLVVGPFPDFGHPCAVRLPQGTDVAFETAAEFCDACAMPMDRFWMYRAKWNDRKETVHVLPHWNWDGRDGEMTKVMCCTSGDEAELFVNGESAGRTRAMAWQVPYEPGEIKVIAFRNGRPIGESSRKTAYGPSAARLVPEQTELADGELAFVGVEVEDEDGTTMPLAEDAVSFAVEGPGEIVAAGNGGPYGLDSFAEKSSLRLYGGKGLVVVRRKGGSGLPVKLSATSPGIRPATIILPLR